MIFKIVLLSLISVSSFASLHPKVDPFDAVKLALEMPKKNRYATLQQTVKSPNQLDAIAMDDTLPMQTRWRSITAMSELFNDKSMPFLEKYLKNSEWFMRNAAIISASRLDHEQALKWARQLLDDKSLIVRTSAVQAITHLNGIEAKADLWAKLNSNENFHRGHSLWVRRYIVEALAKFADRSDEQKFIKVLLDSDERLHAPAIQALTRITGENLARGKNLEQKRTAWIKYYKKTL